MSEIALSTFLTHKLNVGGGYEFFPMPSSVEQIAGRLRVLIGSVPVPQYLPPVRNALTFLYGFRDAIEEMQRQYALADAGGMSLIKIEFSLPVGDIGIGSISDENAEGAQFVNIRRFNDVLKFRLLSGINERLDTEPGPWRAFSLEDAGWRPDLLCDVLRSWPMFSNLKAVVYSVPDGSRRGRQVATLFTTHGISNLKFRGDLPFNLEVPLIGSSG